MEPLKTLYHLGKSGKVYSWRIWTEGSEIVSEAGTLLGEKIISRKIAESKNTGKTNATTPESQAEIEAKALWKHKIDRKYCDSIDKVKDKKISVMLAPNKSWHDTKKYAVFPGDIEIKYDGARCLAYWNENERLVLLSRGGKEWNLPHIKNQLEKILPKDAMFDGELYYHGVSRQTIQKWVTKNYPETIKIEYHVYDIPMADGEEKPWSERSIDLEKLVPGEPMKADPNTPNIVRVLVMEVNNEEEVLLFQEKAVEQGFEGAMFRNRKGMYDWGHRSKDLLKIKTFQDDEYEVIGYEDGTGKNVGIVKWICQTKDGKPFGVDPLGTYAERAELFKNADQYIGKLLTVKFQGYTDEGKPCFAKGVAFRLEEDMD